MYAAQHDGKHLTREHVLAEALHRHHASGSEVWPAVVLHPGVSRHREARLGRGGDLVFEHRAGRVVEKGKLERIWGVKTRGVVVVRRRLLWLEVLSALAINNERKVRVGRNKFSAPRVIGGLPHKLLTGEVGDDVRG